MREYVKTETGERLTLNAVNRLLNGQTKITERTSQESLDHWGFAVCEQTDRPGDYYRLATHAEYIDGVWRQQWEPIAHTKEQLKSSIEQSRKQQESIGVTVNGVRYSGDQNNRIALQEALTAANEYGITEFTSWKDSDDVFHSNIPVSDVHTALSQIGQRRMMLIGLESQYSAMVDSGEITMLDEVSSLTWSI